MSRAPRAPARIHTASSALFGGRIGLALATLVELNLKDCGLTSLPPAIQHAESLTKLDLGGNDLTTLPDELARCSKLSILFILGSRRMTAV